MALTTLRLTESFAVSSPAFDGEVAREHGELLDGLVAREFRVALVDPGLQLGTQLRRSRPLFVRSPDSALLTPGPELLDIDRDQCREKLSTITVDDHLGHQFVGPE